MQSSVLCGVRVNTMEKRPLVAIGRKATDRIRDNSFIQSRIDQFHVDVTVTSLAAARALWCQEHTVTSGVKWEKSTE